MVLICRRFTRVGLALAWRSMARNSGSCQINRPSIRSEPITSTLIGSCSRIQACSKRTPGRLGSRGAVSIGFGSETRSPCCSSAKTRPDRKSSQHCVVVKVNCAYHSDYRTTHAVPHEAARTVWLLLPTQGAIGPGQVHWQEAVEVEGRQHHPRSP